MIDPLRMKEAVESAAADYLASRELPGLAIALVHQGSPVTARGFGCLDIRTGAPVTGTSIFHLASVSKTFVAAELLLLAERKVVAIDRPAAEFLPSFTFADPRYRAITLGHMLSHTSGVSYSDDSRWGLGPDDDGALTRYVRSLANLGLVRAPGEAFHYNNTCFEILGALIAEVRGTSFEEAMRADLLAPTGMASSSFFPDHVDQAMRAWPHLRDETANRVIPSPVYPYNRKHGPSSTLHSSAVDLCRFLAMCLEGGGGILKPESLALAFTPRASCGPERPGTQIGLSWFLGTHRGLPIRFHGGHDTGFTSRLLLAPGPGIGLAILCNCDDCETAELALLLLDAALGEGFPS